MNIAILPSFLFLSKMVWIRRRALVMRDDPSFYVLKLFKFPFYLWIYSYSIVSVYSFCYPNQPAKFFEPFQISSKPVLICNKNFHRCKYPVLNEETESRTRPIIFKHIYDMWNNTKINCFEKACSKCSKLKNSPNTIQKKLKCW